MLESMATIAITLNKPLSARLMPVPDLSAGQRTAFDFEYFANARALPIKSSGISELLSQNQFMPSRIQIEGRSK